MQRSATRFIIGNDYSEYERLSRLNLLPLHYRREINDIIFDFKCLKNNYWNFNLGDLYQICTLQRYYHDFLVMLATFNEYHWSFPTCGAQISYKINTLGRSVLVNSVLFTVVL